MPTFRAGIDLGATKIQAVVVGPDHAVVGQARNPTPTEGGPHDVAARIADSVREAAEGAGVAVEELGGIGIGSPGAVDQDAGTVASARNLPNWEAPFPLAAVLTETLGPPTRVDNDVQVAVLGELELGAGKPFSSFLGVWWGTGVGGGIVLDRSLWLGRGAAGEIGHMVVKRGGARCPCGRLGCLEAYAGRGAMEARARELHDRGRKTDLFHLMEKRGRDRLTSGVWADALDRDDHSRQGSDPPRGPRARSRYRLGREPPRRGGRRHRRRARHTARRAVRREDRGGDAAAPLRRHPAPGHGPGGAGRPRRRGRRRAPRRALVGES